MANVVEILLQIKETGLAELQKVESGLGNLGNTISGLGAKAGAIGAVAAVAVGAGVAFVKMAQNVAESVEQLDRMSVRTGVSQQNLQILMQIVKEGGGNVESLSTALSFLNRAIGESNPLLKQLGITTKDPLEAMLELSKAFASSEDSAKKNLVAFKLLGRGGTDLIADVEKLSGAWNENSQAMRDAGIVMSEDTLDAARDLDKELDTLGRNFEGLKRKVEGAIVPIVNRIFNLKDAIKDLGSSLQRAFTPGAGAGILQGTMGAGISGGTKAAKDLLAGVGSGGEVSAAQSLAKVIEWAAHFAIVDLQAASGQLGVTTGLGRRPFGPDALAGPVDQIGPRGSAAQNVLGKWHQVVRDFTEGAASLDTVFSGLWNGLQSGFQNAFAGILEKGTTFGSLIVGLFKSIVQEILASLGSLVASKLFGLLLTIVGVALPGGATVTAAAGVAAAAGVPVPIPGFGDLRTGSPGGVTNVWNVSTIDARDFVREIVSPAGSVRQANDRVRIMSAYRS